MSYTTTTTSVQQFLHTYGAEGGFAYVKQLLESVVDRNSISQKNACNKCVYIGYKVKTQYTGQLITGGNTEIQIVGRAVTFDNTDATIYVSPIPDGWYPSGTKSRGVGYFCTPCDHLTNYHERFIDYTEGYDRLDIFDYEGEIVSTNERNWGGTTMINVSDTIEGKSYWWRDLFLNDVENQAYKEYFEKSFKYYNGVDVALGTYTGAIKNYNYNTIHQYLSVAPTLVSATTDNINKILNNPWDKYVPELPPTADTAWKVYLDGTKLPNIKVVWHNNQIEEKKKIENTRINVSFAEVDAELPDTLRTDDFIKNTETVPYDDGNYKISFKDFYSNCGNGEYDEGISSIFPKKSGWLILSIDYYKNVTEVLPTVSSQKMCARILPSGELVGYYGIWTEETDKSTIKIILNGIDAETGEEVGDGSEDDGYTDEKDSEENDLQDGQNNSLGVLTSTYNMTRDRLNQLGAFLWGANVFDNFSLINSNPIENIVSCKNIPMELSGADEIIKIGNVDTGVNGAKISNNFGEIAIGSITIPTKYNSFLDFAPYTKLTIYLPYIGFKELDVTLLMGKMITIKYVVDVITGGCLAEIYVSSSRMYEFSGQVGVDIPITASNRAQVEGAYISNAVGMGASLASGNIQGVASSLVSGAMTKYSYSSTDKPNANCVASANRTCFVIIDRPTYQNLKSFNHTKGRMCNLSKKIGNLKGFTICDKNIDLSGIVATEAEKEELTNILSSGFFA